MSKSCAPLPSTDSAGLSSNGYMEERLALCWPIVVTLTENHANDWWSVKGYTTDRKTPSADYEIRYNIRTDVGIIPTDLGERPPLS